MKNGYLSISIVLAIFVCSLFFPDSTYGQLGFTVSSVIPNGDIGQFFKKGTGVELYGFRQKDDGPWRKELGLFYTALKPLADTFRTYTVEENGSQKTVLPGYLKLSKLTMGYVSAGYSLRVVRAGGFSCYMGAAFNVGIAHMSYVNDEETLIHEEGETGGLLLGFRLRPQLLYQVNEQCELFCSAAFTGLVTPAFGSYTHYTYGVGFNFFFDEGNNY